MKTARQQLSRVAQTTISPARVRRYLDVLGVNKEAESKLSEIRSELYTIRKDGATEPQLPASLADDATDIQKKQHAEMVELYKLEKVKYDSFTSDRYRMLEAIHHQTKILRKIISLTERGEKRNSNQEFELSSLLATISGTTLPKKPGEDEESYQARFEKASQITPISPPLKTAADAAECLAKLKADHKEIEYFYAKDELSRTRIRFNDPAAVALAAAIELFIEDMIECGMETAIAQQKKTVQPEHCVSPAITSYCWFPLVRDLPHFQAVVNRRIRHQEYETEKIRERQSQLQRNKAKAKKDRKTYQQTKFKYPSFAEVEAENGYAQKIVQQTTSADGKLETHISYFWRDIDTVNVTDDTDFSFYIGLICKKIIARQADVDNTDFLDIKISSGMRKFFSDLIIDFIECVTPMVRILIEAIGVKTVDHELIKVLLKLIVARGTRGNTTKESFFAAIDEKINLCANHQSSPNSSTRDNGNSLVSSIVDVSNNSS